MTSLLATEMPVGRKVACDRCGSSLVLSSQGLDGLRPYETYHEFHCPACGRLNYAKTEGQILSVRAAIS